MMATVQPHRVRVGRSVELGLLVLALAIGVAAYALVGIGATGAVPANVLGYGLGMTVIALAMHLVLRIRAPFADPVILPVVVALNGIGLAMIYRRDLGPIIVAWAVSLAVLVLERDLGTSLLFFGLFVAMLYLATERTSWVVIGLALFVGGAALVATTFSHVGARFTVWLHALDTDVFNRAPGGSGQLVRGLFGLASGGLFGTGWGQGRPDLVPYAESDFIVASLGEAVSYTHLRAHETRH